MKRRLATLLVVALVWIVASVFVYRAWQRIQTQGQAAAVCNALAEQDLHRTLELSEGLDLPGEEGRRVTECRALALFALGEREAGITLMEESLETDPGWMPAPILTAAVVEDRRSQGRLQEAWALLEPAVGAHPRDALLLSLELAVRGELEEESPVLEEFQQRLPRLGAAAPTLALHLAERYLKGRDSQRALGLLGDEPPAAPDLLHRWYRLRSKAAAAVGDAAGFPRWIEAWQEAGGGDLETRAYNAYFRSIYGLNYPDQPTLDLLQEVAAEGETIEDLRLRRGIFVRLIGSLAYLGRTEEALHFYREHEEALSLDLYFDQEEMERLAEQAGQTEQTEQAEQAGLGREGLLARFGTLHYTVPTTAAAALGPAARLLLSPDPTAPVDTPYEAHPVVPGRTLEVRRRLGKSPQRWVLRDSNGRTRGSGTIWPADGRSVEVVVEVRPDSAPTPAYAPQKPPADGRRRVLAIVLDCADWRLIRYLETRSDLPVLSTLLQAGRRGVLYSDPPSTAAAMEALVYPNRRRSPSFLGLVYQMGDEIAGLSFVGDNPFSPLHWLVPATDSLFDAVGAGERVAVNLLFSRGTVDAGRHGDMVGPRGQRRRFTDWSARRPLNQDEQRRFPLLADPEEIGGRIWLVEEAAADFDATLAALKRQEIDLLVQRVASLDIFTHGTYGEVTRAGQEDGEHPFFSFYRYLDFRLGQVYAGMDEDDLLLILSDHGIKTSLQHLEDAFFLAVAPQITPGRIPERPDFRGVPRLLAGWFGVETDWPDSGLATGVAAP